MAGWRWTAVSKPGPEPILLPPIYAPAPRLSVMRRLIITRAWFLPAPESAMPMVIMFVRMFEGLRYLRPARTQMAQSAAAIANSGCGLRLVRLMWLTNIPNAVLSSGIGMWFLSFFATFLGFSATTGWMNSSSTNTMLVCIPSEDFSHCTAISKSQLFARMTRSSGVIVSSVTQSLMPSG